jgi:hypothetical protein
MINERRRRAALWLLYLHYCEDLGLKPWERSRWNARMTCLLEKSKTARGLAPTTDDEHRAVMETVLETEAEFHDPPTEESDADAQFEWPADPYGGEG